MFNIRYENTPVEVLKAEYERSAKEGTFSATDYSHANTLVTISNPRPETVDLYYRYLDDPESFMFPLPPGDETKLTTYVNHTFVFRTRGPGERRLLGEYTITVADFEHDLTIAVPVSDEYFDNHNTPLGNNADGNEQEARHAAEEEKAAYFDYAASYWSRPEPALPENYWKNSTGAVAADLDNTGSVVNVASTVGVDNDVSPQSNYSAIALAQIALSKKLSSDKGSTTKPHTALLDFFGNAVMNRQEDIIRPSPCEAQYKDWLSRPADLPRNDTPKQFPGAHVLCFWKSANSSMSSAVTVESFTGGVDPRGTNETYSGNPFRFQLLGMHEHTWGTFRLALKRKLNFKKRVNRWRRLWLRQPYGLFDQTGKRLQSPTEVLRAQFVLLFEGGQFMWLPVRKGYVREVPNPHTGAPVFLETLSLQPILYRIRNFLRMEECDTIIEMGRPHMENSTVMARSDEDQENDSDEGVKDMYRTSTQARIPAGNHSLLLDLDYRISNFSRVDYRHNEEVQILRYQKDQFYGAHTDQVDINWRYDI